MTDRVALHLNDDWAITYDTNQWIVCKARKLRSESKLHPRAFIGSTRTTLARVLREKGVVIDVKAQVVMDTWPERFLDWFDWQNAERRTA